MPRNFTAKGFMENWLQFMKQLEKNKLCCLDFLTSVTTEDSSSVTFTGLGTRTSPLIATVIGGGGIPASPDSAVQFNNAGVFGGSPSLIWQSNVDTLQVQSTLNVIETPTEPLPEFAGKNIYWMGDSITAGDGSTDRFTKRFSVLVSQWLGATEVNAGIAGSTMEKRIPLDPVHPGVNMLDRLTDIPTYNAVTDSILVFMFGMNDYGYTGPNYNPTNFTTDYNTALDYAVAHGWSPANILIISPTYPTDASFAFYAALTGLSAPDRARMVAFVAATAQIAASRGTQYLDMYNAMLNASTVYPGAPATFLNGDGVHPVDFGYSVIASIITNFLGGSVPSVASIIVGNTDSVSSDTPNFISLGGTYSSIPGDRSMVKLRLYDNGNPSQIGGFGISANCMEYHTVGSGKHSFYAGGTIIMEINNGAFINLPASDGTPGTAAIKLTAGTLLVTPEDGTIEWDGTNLYFTQGGVRKIVTLT